MSASKKKRVTKEYMVADSDMHPFWCDAISPKAALQYAQREGHATTGESEVYEVRSVGKFITTSKTVLVITEQYEKVKP